jgi:hypothetical protein
MTVASSRARIERERFGVIGPAQFLNLLRALRDAAPPDAVFGRATGRYGVRPRVPFRTAHMRGVVSWDAKPWPWVHAVIDLSARPRRGRGGCSLRISCAGVADIDGDVQYPQLAEFRAWLRTWNRQSGGLLRVLAEAGGANFTALAYERG